jgi:chromosome segregation ATPase
MEFEQIAKRLEWLDEQERKNKTSLSDLSEKVTSLETSVNALTKQLKSINKELAEAGPVVARLGQFDEMMSKQRVDLNKMIGDLEKGALRREKESAKLHQSEVENINKIVLKLTDSVEGIQKTFKDRGHEEQRLSLAIQDMHTQVESALGSNREIQQAQKSLEEARRQDSKRQADQQGDLAAIRKRADDAREKTILHADSIRNLENRIGELLGTESTRREAQTAFLQQQALAQVERDRAWSDWQEKYESFKQQAEHMDAQVTALDDSLRAAKRAQDAYNDLNQKLERRIAEVSEMQRLAEDRVRQEWVAFKADEQKRWTGHSLSQEESMRDLRKDMDKLEERVNLLDETAQTAHDQLHQTTDTTEKQLQELMNLAHEWLTAYERIMGHTRTKAKKTSR